MKQVTVSSVGNSNFIAILTRYSQECEAFRMGIRQLRLENIVSEESIRRVSQSSRMNSNSKRQMRNDI